jgi:hypothetical protein
VSEQALVWELEQERVMVLALGQTVPLGPVMTVEAPTWLSCSH